MHMLSHMTGLAQCPGCSAMDETFDHLFHCPHPLMASTREAIIAALRKKGLKRHIPRPFIDCITTTFSSHFASTQPHLPTHPQLAQASEAQSRIGTEILLRGYLATAWSVALDKLGADHPLRMMLWLLRFIWFDCVGTLWNTRNDILHRHKNEQDLILDSPNSDSLQWFLENDTALNSRDQYLLQFSTADIVQMSSRTKSELVRLLTAARDLHSAESAKLHCGVFTCDFLCQRCIVGCSPVTFYTKDALWGVHL